MVRLQAQAVSLTLGGVRILEETSLVADSGELISVCGPNGAGKSSLLAVMAGEIGPTTGDVLLGDQSMSALSLEERSRRRAYLPPSPPTDLPFTVDEVVAMGRHPWRRSSVDDTDLVMRAKLATGVVDFSQRVLGSLSTGEAQLAHIARSLVQDTDLLLLDEPTAGLDIAHQERVLLALGVAAAQGRTVVTVIHDLNAAASVADRLLLVSRGSVVASGRPAEVLESGLLTEVYGHPIAVVQHPFREIPLVLLR